MHRQPCPRCASAGSLPPASRPPWRNVDEVEFATLEWVDWFNNRRMLEPLGGMPPSEYEALYEGKTSSLATGAGLN